jgi:IS30 family transposase
MSCIIRGKMTDGDRAEIERLAATMARPTAGKIAREINRHPSTVGWYMLTHGLIDREPRRAPRIYYRNGRAVHPYSEEHDARVLELRSAGRIFREIAEILTAEFGIARSAHSIQVRIALLSAAPDDDHSAQA